MDVAYPTGFPSYPPIFLLSFIKLNLNLAKGKGKFTGLTGQGCTRKDIIFISFTMCCFPCLSLSDFLHFGNERELIIMHKIGKYTLTQLVSPSFINLGFFHIFILGLIDVI